MAITKTSIFNMALSKLGRERVLDADEDKRPARILSGRWEDTLRTSLASHSWDFAIKQTQLAQLVTTPATRFEHEYQKPGDWLRTVAIAETSDMRPTLRLYKDMGGKIQTDAGSVFLEYVGFTEDTSTFSPLFTNLLATFLALETIKDITGTDAQKQQLVSQHQEAIRAARAHDSVQGPPEEPPQGAWVGSKVSGLTRLSRF